MAKPKYETSGPLKNHFYILDWPGSEPDPDDTLTTHFQKVTKVSRLATAYFDCELVKVGFKKADKPFDVLQYFRDAFRHMRDDDMLVIYYEGGAADCDKDYEWQFENGPKRPVNAYDLIQLFYDSGLNIMLILDCYIPTRFEEKWNVRSDGKGNVEIIARGERVQTAKGKAIQGHRSDFTDNMIKDLKTFVNDIEKPGRDGGYGGYHAPMSLSQLMRSNTFLAANPKRIFDRKTKAKDTVPIARIVILPDEVRASKRISWFLKTIQDEPKIVEDGEDGNATVKAIVEDEGFDEPMDEDFDGSVAGASEGDGLFCTPPPV
ncbi:hypothetical protein M409DRAFT_16763 [Zasmidium cellare ATCC 36951]|uniref:Uncharacterized protein n=1 Tax=Zasmidium cellare ATCC 36951 TaxID=1080233 RepID=A0A6A6D187_ZASCE|nr:uncharacterized protein M409DRAFT_16763 [Zasmidium cellare ATCC 36951]KAF2172803.1 hypothetical protein M409DRAFT_16763 [Zasmidium cellare ATCC 36951]